MFCGRLKRIHDMTNHSKSVAKLSRKIHDLLKQRTEMVWEINTYLKKINDRLDLIIDKLNIKEPVKEDSKSKIFHTPIKIRL